MPGSSSSSRPPAWQIVVAGGGIPGLLFALATVRALGEAVAVAVLDPGFAAVRADPRAYALAPGVVGMLEALGLWGELRDRAQPIGAMTITDSRLADAVRPAYLRLGGTGEPLAHMVEADRLVSTLRSACVGSGVALLAEAVTGFAAGPSVVEVAASGGLRRAALLVAADGSRSRLRDLAGIAWFGRRYRQSGIVATVRHGEPHGGTAIQHFLPAGPFAILPLVSGRGGGGRSSVVWTEDEARVPALLRLRRDEAAREIAARFGPELGPVELETDLLAFPLSVGLARSYVAPRFALLADAAHEVHPLAGQGLNLGLADAASLADQVSEAVRLGLDPGGEAVLDAYQRERRIEGVALAAITDGLNRLFSNDRLDRRVLRDLGLGLVDASPGAKRVFERWASLRSRRAPRLMQAGRR